MSIYTVETDRYDLALPEQCMQELNNVVTMRALKIVFYVRYFLRMSSSA